MWCLRNTRPQHLVVAAHHGRAGEEESSDRKESAMSAGLQITRRFTEAGRDPYETIEWSRRNSRITNPDGSVGFEMEDAEIPAGWSQVAADIMVSKYFRKAGVPQYDENGEPIRDENGEVVTGPERSARQVFDRLASTWRHWGRRGDISHLPRMPRRSRTRSSTCWPTRWPPPTARSGSTPASTTPTASPVRLRASGTSTPSPTKSYPPPTPTPAPPPTLASS